MKTILNPLHEKWIKNNICKTIRVCFFFISINVNIYISGEFSELMYWYCFLCLVCVCVCMAIQIGHNCPMISIGLSIFMFSRFVVVLLEGSNGSTAIRIGSGGNGMKKKNGARFRLACKTHDISIMHAMCNCENVMESFQPLAFTQKNENEKMFKMCRHRLLLSLDFEFKVSNFIA